MIDAVFISVAANQNTVNQIHFLDLIINSVQRGAQDP